MNNIARTLSLLPETFAICRLSPDHPIPTWAIQRQASFFAITQTREELSIICPQDSVPLDENDIQADTGWRCFKLEGPFELDEPGGMVSLASPLAQAGISVFAEATYDTDYLLVNQLDNAIATLKALNHTIVSL